MISQISSQIRNQSVQKIYQFITTHPGCPTTEIAKEVGLSRRYVINLLKVLKDSKLVERTGSATKSGGWTIVEK